MQSTISLLNRFTTIINVARLRIGNHVIMVVNAKNELPTRFHQMILCPSQVIPSLFGVEFPNFKDGAAVKFDCRPPDYPIPWTGTWRNLKPLTADRGNAIPFPKFPGYLLRILGGIKQFVRPKERPESLSGLVVPNSSACSGGPLSWK